MLLSHEFYLWKVKFSKYHNKEYVKKLKVVLGNVLGAANEANVICVLFINKKNVQTFNEQDLKSTSFHKPFSTVTFVILILE